MNSFVIALGSEASMAIITLYIKRSSPPKYQKKLTPQTSYLTVSEVVTVGN